MGILWVHTGTIGCIVLSNHHPFILTVDVHQYQSTGVGVHS